MIFPSLPKFFETKYSYFKTLQEIYPTLYFGDFVKFRKFSENFRLKIFDQIRKLVGFWAKLPERFPSEALSPKPGPNLARGLSPNHVTYTESSEKFLRFSSTSKK